MISLRTLPRTLRDWLEGAGRRTASRNAIGRQVGALRMVAVLSSLVPLLLLGVVAWKSWNLEMEELASQVTSTLSILSEEAEKVFENQELALDWIEDRTKHLTWAEIETSREFFHFSKALADKSPYIDTIFLADAAGRVRATNSIFPVDRVVSVVDRDYFVAAKREATGLHVGEPAKGKLSGHVAFRVARRRSAADGSFDGILGISLSPTYFTKFFAGFGGAASGLICITRTDGTLLVSNSGGPVDGAPQREHPCTILMRTGGFRKSTFVSTFGDATRIGGKRRLRAYPIALGYAVDRGVIRHEWLQDLTLIGAAALTSSLVLFWLSVVALRIAQSERRAIEAWQEEVKQRQRVEAEARQASKMEALGRMAGGIAHHFNNLLPALSGLLDVTLGEVPPKSATAQRLERMLEAVTQGRQLVRGILLFSRRQVSSHERVAISTSIEDMLALVQSGLPANVKVATRLGYRGEVVADRSQLQEVFMNLISNATQAIGTKDGTIELMTEHTTIDADSALHLGVKPGEFVRVVCRDDGAGMSSEVIEHAFDPFFTTKPGAEGTGLGLAIVHGIVTGLGGSAQVESAPGLGTSFSLYFPLAAGVEHRSNTA